MKSNRMFKALSAAMISCALGMPAHALLLSATNSTPLIVDANVDFLADGSVDLASLATRRVTLGPGVITGVTVTLDFMKCADPLVLDQNGMLPATCDEQGPAFASEILFGLGSPGGTFVSLVTPDTYFGSDPEPGSRIVVTFDDAGPRVVGLDGFKTETAHGEQLFFDALKGIDAEGVWTLYVGDDGILDPLGLARFTLDVTVDPTAQPAPEPATLALLGLGLAGIFTLRRRRA